MGDARETGNERENEHGCGLQCRVELGKMLLLRQTIDGDTAFGIFSLFSRIYVVFLYLNARIMPVADYKTDEMR